MTPIIPRRGLFVMLFLCTCFTTKAQTAEELVQKGLQLDSLKHYYQAISFFTRAIEKDPTQAVVYYDRANSYMNVRSYSMALVDFNKAIYMDTSLTEAYYNRHLANRFTGNYQFALADISEYLKRVPNDPDALDARADLATEMKDYPMAIDDIQAMLKQDAGNRNLKIRLGEMYVLNKDFAKAETLYGQMIAEDADDAGLYLGRAYVRYYMGNYESSVNDINLFMLRQPGNAEALKLKADNYFYLKKFEDASVMYHNILETDSLNASLMADYGHCLLQLNKFREAETILTRSILTKTDNPAYAYLGRGIARFNLGKGDEACSDWVKSQMLGEKRAGEYLEKNCKTQESPIIPR